MTLEEWNIVASVATAAGTLLAATGLIFAWWGLTQNARALELQVLDSILRDIRELDRQFIAEFAGWNHSQKNAWSASFFNTVEYLCFIANHKITKQTFLKQFFFDAALSEWEKLLLEHSQQGVINNTPEMFPEFKKACGSLRK